MTELEQVRRRIDYELTKNLGGVVGLPLRRDFERLVREDERRLTVEECARLRCRRCAAGEIANWTEMGWRHGNILMCQANDIRSLLPQVRAEEKPALGEKGSK